MKFIFLLSGLLLFSSLAMAGQTDSLRLNTFLTEAFPGEGNGREFSGVNSKEENCDVRFRLNHYLHVSDSEQTASAPLYEVKVTKLNNLKAISFSHKKENGPNWFGDRRRIYKTEVQIQKTNSGYKFVVTEREGLLNKFRSRTDCSITL